MTRPRGFGGITGGGVSECETLPNMHPMGIKLDGSRGTVERAGGSDEDKAGTELGKMAHGMGSPRGGHYHCMGEGCSYKTRSSHGLRAHVASHAKKHGTASSVASASSSAHSKA